MMERQVSRLSELLEQLHAAQALGTALNSDQQRLLGQAAADADIRAQVREGWKEIRACREHVQEIEREINSVLDKLDRPDWRGELLAQRAKHEAEIADRPTTRREER
jgi:chromosome segregation ATPase